MKHTICIIAAALLAFGASAADGIGLHTVVIDAGHGGKDAGAVSKDKKSLEKNFTLDIARRLSSRISSAYPDVKVVLTRSDDRYVALNDRARIANKANANLFISLHVNASTKPSPNGYSVHILGQSSNKNRDLYAYNRDVCQRENSVILLEEDYSTTYQGFNPNDPESYIFMTLMQSAYLEQSMRFAQVVKKNLAGGPIKVDRGISQDPFWVLWATSMPSVLVEMGFISNSSDVAQLRSADGRDELADRLFNAFREYKTLYDYSVSSSAPAGKETRTEGAGNPAISEGVRKPDYTAAAGDKPGASSEEKPSSGPDLKLFPGVQAKQPEAAGETASASVQESPASVPDTPPAAERASGKPSVIYGVQILALGRELDPSSSMFMGYTPTHIRAGNVHKYFIAVSKSEQQSRSKLASIRKKYPDAFLVRIEGESVTRVR